MTATPVSIGRLATAGQPPLPTAPGTGNSGAARPFGQQLQDARDSAGPRPENGLKGHAKGQRAAARSTEKKDADQACAGAAAVIPPAAPLLPLSLSLPVVPAAGVDGAPSDPRSDSGAPSKTEALTAPAPAGPMPPDSSNTDVSQQQPAVDATAGDAGQPGAGADLTFALKLTPQQTLDSTAAPRQPEAVDAGDAAGSQRAKTTQTQNSPPSALALNKDNALPAQDGISVKGNTAPKEPAAVVSPAKGARQNDAGQDTAHSGPRDQTPNVQTPPIPVPVKAAAGYSTSATPSASEQPHLETAAKALDATPVQLPASEQAGVKTPGPLKDLAMQVGQTAHDKVELRVVDRSGELQVTVRASNPDLAQGLRQGLSDLVDRLEQNGFRAEAWRPGTAANSVPVTGDARQRPPQFQNEGGQPQSGGSQQGRQQNGQNQSRPRWVQELEGTLTGGQSSFQGESYGISR